MQYGPVVCTYSNCISTANNIYVFFTFPQTYIIGPTHLVVNKIKSSEAESAQIYTVYR